MARPACLAVVLATSLLLPGCVAFDPAQHHALGSEYGSGRAQSVAFGDVNGDGIANALVATGPRGSITDQGGGGSLGYGSEILVGSPTEIVRTARFNADSIDDVAVLSDDGVTVYFGSAPSGGNSGGLHEDDKATITNPGRSFMAVGDFNGDGKQDVAVDHQVGLAVGATVFPGDGTGGFGAGQTSSFLGGTLLDPCGIYVLCAVTGATSMSAANLDGAGADELVLGVQIMTGIGSFGDIGWIGGGSGSGGCLAGPPVLDASRRYTALGAGRLDGDTGVDLAAVRDDGQVALLKGGGTACAPGFSGFGAGGGITTVTPPADPKAAVVRDLDGDGKGDLAVAAAGPGQVALFTGKGDGTFVSGSGIDQIDANVGAAPTDLAFGPIDGDAKPDLLVPNSSENYAQTTYLLNRSGPPFP